MKLSIFFFFFFFDVELWLCENLIGQFGWLSLFSFFFFFFFLFLSFLNLAAHTLCSLASYTPALIIFFFFFLGPVVQPQQCLCCVLCVCGLCVVCLCVISVFVFGGCVCVLGVHILPKFQFWNWNLEKNNLKIFWKSYNINNINFFFLFFFFKGLHHPTFID